MQRVAKSFDIRDGGAKPIEEKKDNLRGASRPTVSLLHLAGLIGLICAPSPIRQ